MVDGVSNGVSTKYNQNCLDVAYKNAYEEADGKKTDSSTFPNYKCYKDGKEIYCNEVREDGQTENAKTDHFVNKLPDGLSCVGVPESQKVYEGSVVSCDDVAYKNGYCKASGVSPCDLSGFKCYQDRVATACSDVTDDAQNDKAEADYLDVVASTTEFEGSVYIDEGINRNGTLCIGQDQDLQNFQQPITEPKSLAWHFKYQPVDNNPANSKGGLSVISIFRTAKMFTKTTSIKITVGGVSAIFTYSPENSDHNRVCFLATNDVFNLLQKRGTTVKFKVEVI